ncbi:bifunctional hydroxymethylpyrimidine kinase/phosphomethylpyrimidine kinase [Fodinicurvata sp. EGI_FJ10296]|uniref:bifunctional hydroxymethylpyrimidine kinase/phosphomethylpyrimidine kinase n=1 Tax=Fodinicurvata sp. EGI_FJ10296 TaxID=3231908 RepID=UPI00345454C9
MMQIPSEQSDGPAAIGDGATADDAISDSAAGDGRPDCARPWRNGPPVRILSIGVAEPGSASGTHADLQIAGAMRAYAAAVTSSVAIPSPLGPPDDPGQAPVRGDQSREHQSRGGTAERVDIAADFLGRQLLSALGEVQPQAIKVGLLPLSASVDSVVDILMAEAPRIPKVVDAVCVGRDGLPLVEPDVVAHLKRRLIVGADVLVARIADAEVLAGMSINTLEDKRHAALMLRTIGAETVVLVEPAALGDRVADYVAGPGRDDQGDIEEVMDYPRPSGWHVRGVSGAMATATAIGLARGLPAVEAVALARRYVAETIRLARSTGPNCGEIMVCPPYFPA